MTPGDFTLFFLAGGIMMVVLMFCFYMSERQKKDVATSMSLMAAARHLTVILPLNNADTLPIYTPRFVIVPLPSDTPPSYELQSISQPETNSEASNTTPPAQEPSMEEQQAAVAPVYSESTPVPLSSSSPSPQAAAASPV
ncbi:hypothetical protein BGZ59_010704 [Podila verticillata]|nr:hypothetical protein BGZ59_010704 [Podila verticillata]KFH69703.1 hypothetical protein MVEG_04509 [Podila verticillata NRRL 6337]